jgi:hypothetical protein
MHAPLLLAKSCPTHIALKRPCGETKNARHPAKNRAALKAIKPQPSLAGTPTISLFSILLAKDATAAPIKAIKFFGRF